MNLGALRVINGRSTYLRIFTTASVLIGVTDTYIDDQDLTFGRECRAPLTGVQDVNTDFTGTRGSNLDFLELERLACTPANGGLACDDLARGI